MTGAPQARLAGRRVLITGAGRGLGRAYALDAARAGAVVVVNDLDPETADETADLIRRAGGRAEAVPGSVATWSSAAALVERAAGSHGLDGLVTNAGVFRVEDPWETNETSVADMVGTNLVGTIATAVHAMAVMEPGSSIVTVISGAAGGMSGMAVYGATKGAVLAATLSWAIDLAPRGIRVNAISPLAETRLTDIGRLRLGQTPPQPRPESIAPLVTFLLGRASEDLTGTAWRWDGTTLSRLRGLHADAVATARPHLSSVDLGDAVLALAAHPA